MQKVLKIVVVCGIFLVCGMLIARIALASWWPAEVKEVYNSAALRTASGTLSGFTQKPITPYDNKDKGHFFFNHFLAIPEIKEVQVALRYNDSTLQDIAADFGLALSPEGTDERFCFYLRDDAGTVYTLTEGSYCHKLIYSYRRLVFDGIDATQCNYLYLDVYFGDADPSCDMPYGSMLIYAAEAPADSVELSLP